MKTTDTDYYIRIGDALIGSDELVDHNIAAKITGLSPRTMRDKGVKRQIPVYRTARNLTRYLVRDLVEFSEDRRIEPDAILTGTLPETEQKKRPEATPTC